MDRMTAYLRCIPLSDHATKHPYRLMFSCCCCARGDVAKAPSSYIVSTGRSTQAAGQSIVRGTGDIKADDLNGNIPLLGRLPVAEIRRRIDEIAH